ncbi:MAG: TonB-dependent receptor, partial [Muribaculaceae bacterium]|nr:TonB-dependent receptor [Muribaculaceae bacterium]
YTNNSGILETSNMQRTTVGFNLSPKFFNGELSINANAQGSYVRSQEANVVTGSASRMNPTIPVMWNYPTIGNSGLTAYNGFYNILLDNGAPNTLASQNPLQELKDRKSIGNVNSSTGNLQIDYALHWLPELHFNLNLGYQVSKNTTHTDMAANSIMQWRTAGLTNMGSAGAATRYQWYELQRNTMLEFYLNYRKDFTAIKSNLDVVAGYSWQKYDYHGRSQTYVNSLGFVTNNGVIINDGTNFVLDYDQASAANIGRPVNDAPMSRWANHLQLLSFYGRVNYMFDDTYLLTVTLRDDATSRFSKDTRWGLFPAVGLGWKINNMSFMESTHEWLNEMKLRLGWGVTGQQDVGSYFPYLPIYTESYQQGFQYLNPNGDGSYINPLYPEAYDATIKWEETTTWNVGLDMAFLNNRITLGVEWYLRDTKDLLAETIVSGWNTRDKVLSNIGRLRNMG